jgi:predicted nuclease of predicted toxin-antitoxin system
MRFLADECCDFRAVRALQAAGHDVLAVSEFQERSLDRELWDLALAEERILPTEDKDFGWLVYAARIDSAGRKATESALQVLCGDRRICA